MKHETNNSPVHDEPGSIESSVREYQTSVRLSSEEFKSLEEIRSILGSRRAATVRAIFRAGVNSILSRKDELAAVRDIILDNPKR
jgi:hypothetical protein